MMTTLPKGFDYHGVYCYRSQTDSSSFFYIPGAPSSQRTSQGNPMVSLMVLDQFAMLQLSSQWDVTSDQLDGLRTTIAKQFSLALDKIRLLPAPITVQEVVLSLKNNAGDFEVLATTQSSGYTPFSTVLSVDLTNEQKAQAIAAFNGRKDQLIVTYKASLEIEVSAEVTISGDVSTDLRKLPRNPALEDCLQQIETAIDRKRLKLELSASPRSLRRSATTHRATCQRTRRRTAVEYGSRRLRMGAIAISGSGGFVRNHACGARSHY